MCTDAASVYPRPLLLPVLPVMSVPRRMTTGGVGPRKTIQRERRAIRRSGHRTMQLSTVATRFDSARRNNRSELGTGVRATRVLDAPIATGIFRIPFNKAQWLAGRMIKDHDGAWGYYLGNNIAYYLNAADPDDWTSYDRGQRPLVQNVEFTRRRMFRPPADPMSPQYELIILPLRKIKAHEELVVGDYMKTV